MRVTIIGGGILGTAHAWQAVRRGHEVTHLEREDEVSGATARSFGLIWVSGRSSAELDASLRSRTLWEELGSEVPGIGFRARGSLTLLRTPGEVAVAEEVCTRADTGRRGFRVLEPAEARRINPVLRGKFLAALYCSLDAVVESREVLPAIRDWLQVSGRYTFLPGTEARSISGTRVLDDMGATHDGDAVIVCAGAAHGGLVRELAGPLPVRRVRLQMMQTAPLGEELTTAIADGDSLRYYPAYAGNALDSLRRNEYQDPIADEYRMQLLCAQHRDGGLTIGDTHEYREPLAFDVAEAPYTYLAALVEELLGRTLPPIRRRWAGVYSQSIDPGRLVYRAEVADNVWVVTGPGGRGMTLGPAIGEQTADKIGL